MSERERLPGWEDEPGSDERMTPAALVAAFLKHALAECEQADADDTAEHPA